MKDKAFGIKLKVWFLTTGLLVFFCTDVLGSNVMSMIAKDYQLESVKWFAKLQGIAKGLFWRLAALEFVWSTITWLLKERDTQSFTAALLKKIMSISFFYMLVQKADQWLPMIINSFAKAGGLAANVGELNPSKILDLGINTSVALLESLKNLSIWSDFGPGFVGIFAAIFIFLSFVFIACQMMIALVESYLVTGAGVLFLGLGGSRWTSEYAQKYIGYAFSIGVKLFTIYLIIGVGTANAEKWGQVFLDAKKIDYNLIFYVLGGSILLAASSWLIPKFASSMLSGAPSLSAGNVAGAAVGAITTTAAVGAMGVSAGKAGIGGIKNAINAGREGYNKLSSAFSKRSGGSSSGSKSDSSSSQLSGSRPTANSSSHTSTKGSGKSETSGKDEAKPSQSDTKTSSTSDGSGLKRSFKGAATRRSAPHIPNDEGPSGSPHIRMNHTE